MAINTRIKEETPHGFRKIFAHHGVFLSHPSLNLYCTITDYLYYSIIPSSERL